MFVQMANGASGGRRLRQLLHKENDEVIRSHTLMTVKLAETGKTHACYMLWVKG